MSFHDVQLPLAWVYGSRRTHEITNRHFSMDSGDVAAQVTMPVLLGAVLVFGPINNAALAQLYAFYRARHGPKHSFRLTDPLNFSTAQNGIAGRTGIDQPVQLLNGQYRLVKAYGVVNKPLKLVSSVIITDGGTDVTSSCTIDADTGIVTGYTPSGDFRAGCLFDHHVRFDGPISMRHESGELWSCQVGVREVYENPE